MSRKITLEDKKKAVQVALSGGVPEEYLRSLGMEDPYQAWYGIKKKLKEADPMTWEALEAMKKAEEKPKRRRKEEQQKEITAEAKEIDRPLLKNIALSGKNNDYALEDGEIIIRRRRDMQIEQFNLGDKAEINLFIRELLEAVKTLIG